MAALSSKASSAARSCASMARYNSSTEVSTTVMTMTAPDSSRCWVDPPQPPPDRDPGTLCHRAGAPPTAATRAVRAIAVDSDSGGLFHMLLQHQTWQEVESYLTRS